MKLSKQLQELLRKQQILQTTISHCIIQPWLDDIQTSIRNWFYFFGFIFRNDDVIHYNHQTQTNIVPYTLTTQTLSPIPTQNSKIVPSSEEKKPALSDALKRISELETELNAIKQKLRNTEQNIPVNQITLPIIIHAPPPPPPPPPPPLMLTNIANEVRTQIKKNRLSIVTSTPKESQTTPLTSLAEVIKNAKGVKLRKVERSPGGTPIRKAPLKENDLADILSRAMKKRFHSIHPTSDDSDSFSRSPSPEFILKRKSLSRRRLSPLAEITN